MSGPEDKNESTDNAEEDSGIRVNVFGRTDVGLVRDHNEDNFLVADLNAGNRSIKPEVREHTVGKKGSLFVVCDGMGGAAAGEVASKIGIDTIYELMQDGDAPNNDQALAKKLDDAITEAGVRIFTAAKVDRRQRGMGTTATAAALNGSKLIIGQVGDSRAYILRDKKLVQVTKDQSLVQQLLDAKQLTEEEARNFDKANIILQALGTAEELHVDLTYVDLRQGDVLMMCSDGLTGPVTDELVERSLLESEDPAKACKLLTDLACEGGGQDNITVIAVRFEGEGLPEADDSVHLDYQKFGVPENTKVTVPSMPGGKDAVENVKKYAQEHKTQAGKKPQAKQNVNRQGDKQKSRTGLIVGGAIVLIVCCALGGYFLSSNQGEVMPGDLAPHVPVESLPDPAEPSTSADSGQADTMDQESEPVLAPTPEEAISGTEVPVKPTTGTAAGSPSKPDGEDDEDIDKPNKPAKPYKPGGGAGGSSNKPDSNQGQIQKPEEDKPVQEPAIEPVPIDDNPF